MSVSGEGASLRSTRTWLLLLCPEIPDQSGGNGAESVTVIVEGGRCLGRSQRRHGMPSIAAFGRSRLSTAVDRGSRPSAAAADREIENRCNADP